MRKITRRRFLELGAAGGAAMLVPWRDVARAAGPTGVTPNLTKFVEPLPIPPVIDATGGLPAGFAIGAGEATTYRFHSQLGPARTWGYGGAPYLGPTLNAKANVPVTITWENHLRNGAFIPNDPTLMGAVLPGHGAVPIVTHLHGKRTLPQFDGTPLQWFTADGATGPHFVTNTATYGNEQRATMLWYHDHALGNTRTNVYAGLAGLYFIRDAFDTGLADNPLGLPAGPYEVPLVLQDKTFNADGTLFYPSVGVTAVHPVWVPEFFGDTPVVNGKAYPFLGVEPRRYRFRIVNGSQARFYNLKLVSVTGKEQLPLTVIGTEGGLLRAPVQVPTLLIAPGERYDVIIDFAGQRKGQFLLKNDAKVPFPAGQGGSVTQLMQFNVNVPLSGSDTTAPPATLALPPLEVLPKPSAPPRAQHLAEILDPATGAPIMLQVEDQTYLDPTTGLPTVTTKPAAGSVEDWLLVNTTADTHPMHLHLVHFEVIERQPFNVAAYAPGQPIPFTGPAVPAAPIENGLKDTVRANPGEATRIRARFDLPSGEVVLPANGLLENPQYVWHCHILEHEENDMMRAFEVVV